MMEYEVLQCADPCVANGKIVTVVAGLLITASFLATILSVCCLFLLAIVKWRWLFEFLAKPPDESSELP